MAPPMKKDTGKKTNLSRLDNDQLLRMRFCELGLEIEGTWLEGCVSRLHGELTVKGIGFHPSCFLADEWLCPDGEPIIGIAFFLAHPRLKRLEREMMLEAEGEGRAWCMRLLRHEAGHALNYAYFLYRKKRWRELFGPFSAEYPERYKYRPYSKSFVRHLEEWYAQSHPDEDFAETFAVWLNPRSNWRKEYKGWKALEKLEYVDRLMRDIGPMPPKKAAAQKHWDVSRMRTTLKTYYDRKRKSYAEYYPDFHDSQLRGMFGEQDPASGMPAHVMIKQYHRMILNHVSASTGEKKYIINSLLKDLAARCRQLGLRTHGDPAETVMRVAVYVTSLTMNYLYTGRFKKEKA